MWGSRPGVPSLLLLHAATRMPLTPQGLRTPCALHHSCHGSVLDKSAETDTPPQSYVPPIPAVQAFMGWIPLNPGLGSCPRIQHKPNPWRVPTKCLMNE